MKLLASYLSQHWRLVTLALVLAAINQIFSLLDPLIFRYVIDEYATRFSEYTTGEFFRGVSLLLAAAVGVAFVSRVAKNFQDYFISVITQRLGAQIYSDGIAHSLRLPYSVFEDQRSGETLGRLQKVRTDVERLIQVSINVLFTSLVGVIFVVIYAFSVHWVIAPVYFLTVPLLGVLSSVLSRKIKTIQKVIVAETTALAGSTTESLRNIELVKSLGLAQQEVARLNATTDKILKLELKKVRYIRSLSFIQGTTVNALRTSILFLMLYLIYTQAITVGQFFSLFIYSFFIFGPLQELGNIINVYRETEVSLKNFADVMAMPVEPRPAQPVPLPDLERLAFDGVSFTHQTATTPALTDISFEVRRGDTVAFVGPSGSGKTTLVKLLVGFYPPSEGKIFVDGYEMTAIDRGYYRAQVGYVMQSNLLFSGTIAENIASGDDSPDRRRVEEVAKMADAHAFISKLPLGYEQVVGERGVGLSGGQVQRLCIARALYHDPRLLVFDEATSALDTQSESNIMANMEAILAGRTAVIIAHRLSTIMRADKIVVLYEGKIAEQGRHDELLARRGMYYELVQKQLSSAT